MKIKDLTAVIILALVCLAVVSGQKRRSTRGRSPQPKPTATPTPAPTPTIGSLSVEAGLIYESGDVKPVARTTFILLDEDLRIILKPFGETPGTLGSMMDLLRHISEGSSTTIDKEHQEKARAEYSQIKSAVESHIVATATTDFSGKAKFESLAPGIRFVYGEFRVGDERVAWNVKVELAAGKDAALILDNSNRSP